MIAELIYSIFHYKEYSGGFWGFFKEYYYHQKKLRQLKRLEKT